MKEVQLSKDQVKVTFKILDEEFAVNVKKAEQENDMTHASKANFLKRKSNEKKIEFKKLEEASGIS